MTTVVVQNLKLKLQAVVEMLRAVESELIWVNLVWTEWLRKLKPLLEKMKVKLETRDV